MFSVEEGSFLELSLLGDLSLDVVILAKYLVLQLNLLLQVALDLQ